MEDIKLYTLVVDGAEYKSSSPLTEETIERKKRLLESSAMGDSRECSECPKD